MKLVSKSSLALAILILIHCDQGNREKVYEDFAIGQDVVFAKSTVIFDSKAECEKFFRQLGDYPLELTISAGVAFYVDENTRASITEQGHDTLRVLITEGKLNGYHGWTSKLFVRKVFPVLPAG